MVAFIESVLYCWSNTAVLGAVGKFKRQGQGMSEIVAQREGHTLRRENKRGKDKLDERDERLDTRDTKPSENI